MLLAWAGWLQDTSVAQALRAEAWIYPLVNVAHVLGVALLFGGIAALDLRLMGAWRGVPVGALARPLVPLAGAGLALAVASGLLLVTVQAVDYVGNPFFAVKLLAIALSIVNIALTHRLAGWRLDRPKPTGRLAVAGGLSLLCWLTAVAAGRLIAYW